MKKLSIMLLAIICVSLVANAEIRLPQLFQSGMVMQRGKPIPVWGWADKGEQVTITFQKKTYTTTADDEGRWRIDLPKQKAGGPFTLEVNSEGVNSEKWVLLLNINPGGPFGGSATQYFVGTFDGRTFTCEDNPSETKWMDYGKDHYATVTFHGAPDGRIVALPWMSNWQYANQVPTQQFRSANGLPRDLGLTTVGGETYLTSTPSKEVLALRGKKVKQPTETCEIVVDVKGSANITLSNAKGEQVTMHYDAQQQTFSMDRRKSGDVSFSESFPCVTTAPTYGNIRQLRIFIDRCSIEAFDSDGKMAMTNLVFPSEPYNTIKVKGGKATIYEIR